MLGLQLATQEWQIVPLGTMATMARCWARSIIKWLLALVIEGTYAHVITSFCCNVHVVMCKRLSQNLKGSTNFPHQVVVERIVMQLPQDQQELCV